MVLVALFTIPIGVGAALYLEEYADRDALVQPRDRAQHPEPGRGSLDRLRDPGPGVPGARALGLGRVLLAGALTLSLLVLPIVIIASREAIRAVPPRSARARWRWARPAGR